MISPRKSQTGSFLLESLVSLLLFMVGLIALLGVSAQSLNQVGQSKSRIDASNLVSELIAQMWVSGAATPSAFDRTEWETKVGTELPAGHSDLTFSDTRVDFDVSWADAKVSGTRHHYITSAEIAK